MSSIGNPPPAWHPEQVHLPKGLVSQRYIVGWLHLSPCIIKVGSTNAGARRWSRMLYRGGRLLHLANYAQLADCVHAETWLHRQMDRRFERAFVAKEDAAAFLGRHSIGYTECYQVPYEEVLDVLDLAELGWWEGVGDP